MSIVVPDMNIVVSLLSSSDALHNAARSAVVAWDRKGARVMLSVVTWTELRVGALRRGPEAERALTAFCRTAVDEIVPSRSQLPMRLLVTARRT